MGSDGFRVVRRAFPPRAKASSASMCRASPRISPPSTMCRSIPAAASLTKRSAAQQLAEAEDEVRVLRAMAVRS